MSQQQSQQLIIEFVAQYHQQKRLAPTVGEIIRGSGVNSYDEAAHAIDALIQRGLVAYVPGVGGAGFTTRQVRLTGRGQPVSRQAGPPATAAPPATAGHQAGPHPAAPARASPPAAQGTRSAAKPAAPPASTWGSAGSGSTQHRQQPMPGLSGAGGPAIPAGSPSWAIPRPVVDTLGRPPVLAAALCAGLGIGLLLAAWREVPGLAAGAPLALGPLALPWAVPVVLAVVVGLGVAIGRRQAQGQRWTWPALARAIALGGLGGVIALAWAWFGGLLSPLDKTGIPALLEGLRILPALLAAAWVPLPGAATLGLIVAKLIDFGGRTADSPALALAQILVAAAPAELWLLRRGADRGLRTLVTAGALIGLGATAAAYLTVPGMVPGPFPLGGWPAEIIIGLIAGTAAGVAVAWLRRRWALTGTPAATRPAPRRAP